MEILLEAVAVVVLFNLEQDVIHLQTEQREVMVLVSLQDLEVLVNV